MIVLTSKLVPLQKKVEGEGKGIAKKVDEQMEDSGRQSKVKGKEQLITDVQEATGEQVSASSLNRFSILDSMDEPELTDENHDNIDEEQVSVEPRKVRAAATGVTDLIKSLKPKKKIPDKGRQKKIGSNILRGNPLPLHDNTCLEYSRVK